MVEKRTGKQYEGTAYEPLFPYAQADLQAQKGWKRVYEVVCDTYVTLTDGTGVVHIAPAFGQDDYNVGRNYGLPVLALVNEQGKFDGRCPELDGLFMKKADKVVLDMLKVQGKLFKALPFEHDYPHCWRCDTPLMYYARESWFIKTTAVKDRLIASNRSVNWIPESIKEGRMGNFLENVIDWGLSRDRYWGTPLPVWVCEDCGEIEVIGSRKELAEKCGAPENIELHRPYLDSLKCKCPHCGGVMKRTPEVIDCWFDSGSMPFAQYHYPFENKDLFEKTFPADFISEAVDQTRGWFYTLLVISTILFDRAPFKNCIVLGHVNDANGIKMSKHKGNVVDPWSVLDKQGADAVRWYFYTGSFPWIPSRFGEEAVSEVQRKYQGTLWNSYAFFTLYAEIDGYDPSKYQLKDCKLTLMDKWVLSKLNTLIKRVDKYLAEYDITDSAREIQDFSDELSNWYVRRGRERYWGSEMTEDKAAAYTTLYTVLVTLAKLTAPFTPFMSEMIYQNLVPAFDKTAPKSVHLCDFPVCDESAVDPALEAGMEDVLSVVALGRAARNSSAIKNRQPLAEMIVASERPLGLKGELAEVALDELNVKKLTVSQNAEQLVRFTLKPQLKTLGPKYGKKLKAIGEFLANCNAGEVVKAVRGGGSYTVDLDGEVVLTEEDLQIFTQSAEGYASASDKGITVALDTKLDEALLDEGCERELVSRIQTMRKEAGFEVTDRILVYYEATGRAERVLSSGALAKDVLAKQVVKGKADGYTKTLDINGDKVTLTVLK
ncbi:MAG: class I tRNA ligase family protein [Clostridia bacterium]|nr:class I tRNA ligase family protein [Clostridia bacterium]